MMEALHLLNDKIFAHLEAEEDLIMPLVLETPPPLEFVVYDEDGNEVASDDFMDEDDEDEDNLALGHQELSLAVESTVHF